MSSPSFESPNHMPHDIQLPAGAKLVLGRQALDSSLPDGIITGDTAEFEGEQFFGEATSELRASIESRGTSLFEAQLEALTHKIVSDPFGDTSIDAFKDTDAGRMARVVHKVTGELADLIPGKKLAIKGTGMDMEKARKYLELGGPRRATLMRQFETTAELAKQQRIKAPSGAGNLLHINEVYGVFLPQSSQPGERRREWMLMELIEDAQPVGNVRIALSRGGTAPGFKAERYPELAAYASAPFPAKDYGLIRFSKVAEKMNQELGILDHKSPLGDLNGNNILEQQTAEGPKYTVIDVQSV